ncbi:MAG: hypothetical protein K2G46_06055, partial [Bacteroidales bacterium]|nr:hypothetical protein [Bacteroidales bacterium]
MDGKMPLDIRFREVRYISETIRVTEAGAESAGVTGGFAAALFIKEVDIVHGHQMVPGKGHMLDAGKLLG